MKMRIAEKILKYDDFDIHETYNKYQIRKALQRLCKHNTRDANRRTLRSLKQKMREKQEPLEKINRIINLVMGTLGVNKIIIDGKIYRHKKDE